MKIESKDGTVKVEITAVHTESKVTNFRHFLFTLAFGLSFAAGMSALVALGVDPRLAALASSVGLGLSMLALGFLSVLVLVMVMQAIVTTQTTSLIKAMDEHESLKLARDERRAIIYSAAFDRTAQ